MDSEDEVVAVKRAEIDTTAPFRSVKEAVALFGEKVLACEVCANKLQEMRSDVSENGIVATKIGTIAAELEETKQNLHKAKEESTLMANYLSSLRQELDLTKKELQQMKERESEKQMMELKIEDVKIVEGSTKFEVQPQKSMEEGTELQNKRYVTFANPPSLAPVIVPENIVLERHPSLKKKKKKPLISLIGGIFSRKQGSAEFLN